jgi:hypothetical protein
VTQTIYSLAQLQAMNADELIAAFPQKNERWIKKGYLVDFTGLLETIILGVKALHYPLTENRGCREVWYNPVKSILLKVERDRIEDPKTDYMATFDRKLSDMVKNGVLTYADLGVNDFRTLKETFDEAQKKAQCWSNILLFVEKDSAYVHLIPLKKLFNINIISGGGWSHTAGIERQLRELRGKGISEVYNFNLTDYDPFGFAIDHEFVGKCEVLGLHVAEHQRIGINVEHATPEILDQQKYPIKRGKHLSVNGVSFNSDEWLKKSGIDGAYGLEIEAISAQPGGHQHLRYIVAQELLKYLHESDRIEEITTQAWKDAPFQALQALMYSVDECETTPETIGPPIVLPTEYISRRDCDRIVAHILEQRDNETVDIRIEIAELEEQLDKLRQEKTKIEEPHQKRLNAVKGEYWASRHLLTYCLWQHYQKTKGQWHRENYDLGYPKGCLLDAVKQEQDLSSFLEQLDIVSLISDLKNSYRDAMNNGAIAEMVEKILKGGNTQP